MDSMNQNPCNKLMISPSITFNDYMSNNFCFNSSPHQYQDHHRPKQEQLQTYWNTSCPLPPSPPTYSSTITKDVGKKPSIMAISSIMNETSTEIVTSQTYRKQKKPSPSLGSCSPQGAFTIPFIIDTTIKKNNSSKKRLVSSAVRKPRKRIALSPPEQIEILSRQTTDDVVNVDEKQSTTESLSIEHEEELIVKKHTEAALVYDRLSADMSIATIFKGAEEWIPSYESFNRKPSVRVQWKGYPLKIKKMPYYEKLHRDEASMAATLRLTPEQFLKCKWALVLAAKEAYDTKSPFRKSEAQKVCCIDVNKTSVLWNAFGKLGWLGPMWPQ
ncbi:hypothetical protein BD560DRAFT_105797 [Blakeslea trispora]|nr:hypothetical protein BD560DRAFT_105797 [Blakeslea trispora]